MFICINASLTQDSSSPFRYCFQNGCRTTDPHPLNSPKLRRGQKCSPARCTPKHTTEREAVTEERQLDPPGTEPKCTRKWPRRYFEAVPRVGAGPWPGPADSGLMSAAPPPVPVGESARDDQTAPLHGDPPLPAPFKRAAPSRAAGPGDYRSPGWTRRAGRHLWALVGKPTRVLAGSFPAQPPPYPVTCLTSDTEAPLSGFSLDGSFIRFVSWAALANRRHSQCGGGPENPVSGPWGPGGRPTFAQGRVDSHPYH
ncbi:hypothetical protein SKAU_G00158180 [Synaphobranchus kaupii]|uniref:Uncharacterized protein n=1 Tax=Synaphobranchus kaupii TaxID=118154 RepID=A0A9Q1FI60_SYNKA|nr:hypothetical protein SKAU_G00158180 [Synaphobranchus kaupii]